MPCAHTVGPNGENGLESFGQLFGEGALRSAVSVLLPVCALFGATSRTLVGSRGPARTTGAAVTSGTAGPTCRASHPSWLRRLRGIRSEEKICTRVSIRALVYGV